MTFETSVARGSKNRSITWERRFGKLRQHSISKSLFFFFFNFYKCMLCTGMYVHMYMYLGTCVWYAYICADGGPSWCPGSSSIACLLNHWGKVSQSALDSPTWSASLISLLWGIPRFCLPRLELWVTHCVFLPLTWVRDPNYGPHVYTASTLTAELPLQTYIHS